MNKSFVRAFAAALALLLCLSLTAPTLAADSGETVTISTAEDFLAFAQNCRLDSWSRGKTIVLKSDISLGGLEFQGVPTFGGTFQGNGHTISGLSITDSVAPTGLFRTVQEGGVIRDLNVSGDVKPDGEASGVGGIAGENRGEISNCGLTGTVTAKKNAGGIAGINAPSGQISGCWAAGSVTGDKMTGGIAGSNEGIITKCENRAYINTNNAEKSLNLKDLDLGVIEDISKINNLDISTAASDTGGIVGYSSGIIGECSNFGGVGYPHVGYNVGGIVGRSSGYVYDCMNQVTAVGRKDVGGIAGQMEPYIVRNMSEDAIQRLRQQLDELNKMLAQTVSDAGSGMGALTARLNSMAGSVDSAASALHGIETHGSITGSVSANGQTQGSGSITVDSSQIEIGGIGAGVGDAAENDLSGVGVAIGSAGEGQAQADLEKDTQGNGNVDASTNFSVTTSVNGLTSAVGGLTAQMRMLNGDISGVTGSLAADLLAINKKVEDISNTVFDTLLGDDSQSNLVDSSQINIDDVTLGKMAGCSNSGSVQGDINIGGIAGSMALEYELDPEDDVSGGLKGSVRRKYELKAILQNCENTGKVEAKHSYVGGITGKMDLGLITQCRSYGDVSSESGSYVGGIAGITSSTIRKSFVKCTLSGKNYIGGIVGSGVEESVTGSFSTVVGCTSMVAIPESTQFVGAISGGNAGTFLENYFISDDLSGIDGVSYAGIAQPMSYCAMMADGIPQPAASETTSPEGSDTKPAESEKPTDATEPQRETIPAEFQKFTLKFVADGEVLKQTSFSYGDSFDDSAFPELPQKDGYYACWDKTDLSNLQFDTVVTAVYVQYNTALPSGGEYRTDGRPIFFAEGNFDGDGTLTAVPQPNTPSSFPALPKNVGETIRESFSGTTLSRKIEEQWALSFPEDGQTIHRIRYLSPSGQPDHLDIYVKNNKGWTKVKTEAIGSYLAFPVEGNQVEVAAISTIPIWWVWLLAGGVMLGILIPLVILLRKIRKKRHGKRIGASPEGETPENGKEAGGEKPEKRRKPWVLPLAVLLTLLVGGAIAAACFLLPGLKTNVQAYDILKKYAEKSSYTMELSVNGTVGEIPVSLDAMVSKQKLDGKTIVSVTGDPFQLFYADGAVYLESGRGYRVGEQCPDYSQLLDLSLKLYDRVDISADQGAGEPTYTITAEGENASALLKTLLPDVELSGVQQVDVTLVTQDKEMTELRFSAKAEGEAPFRVDARMIVQNGTEPQPIPQAVQDAIAKGPDAVSSIVLTRDLYQVVQAWNDLSARNPMAAKLAVSANCGPVILSDTLNLHFATENDLTIGAVEKYGYTLYFSGNRICNAKGSGISTGDDSWVQTGKLLEILYEICLNTQVSSKPSTNGTTYTVALDQDGMKEVAYAIAPSAENLGIILEEGEVSFVVSGGKFQRISAACHGNMQVLLADVPAQMNAEITFGETDDGFTVPDVVYQALRENK